MSPEQLQCTAFVHAWQQVMYAEEQYCVCHRARFGQAQPKADMAQLSKSLEEVVDTLRPSPEEQQRQKEAFQQVQGVLQQRWPQAQVHLFGSTANCLSICNNNDIDVCLELPEELQHQVRASSKR